MVPEDRCFRYNLSAQYCPQSMWRYSYRANAARSSGSPLRIGTSLLWIAGGNNMTCNEAVRQLFLSSLAARSMFFRTPGATY
jgi:hypothetical protein